LETNTKINMPHFIKFNLALDHVLNCYLQTFTAERRITGCHNGENGMHPDRSVKLYTYRL